MASASWCEQAPGGLIGISGRRNLGLCQCPIIKNICLKPVGADGALKSFVVNFRYLIPSPSIAIITDNFESLLDHLADALVRDGYSIFPRHLPSLLIDQLWQELQSLPDNELKMAGIGRQDDFQLNSEIRRDKIHWLTGETIPQQDFMTWMELLRAGLNRRLFLGLFDYECHFASYGKGGFYKKHLDAFKNLASPLQPNRILSTVLYLNREWQPGDGGELLLFNEEDTRLLETVTPEYGKLIIFLSERFPHEVAIARRERQSIAGWFRTQGIL